MERAAVLALILAGAAVGYATRVFVEFREGDAEEQMTPPVAETSATPATHQPRERAHVPGNWREAERNIRYLKPSDGEWFLKKTLIPDFGKELASSTRIQARDPKIEGCFQGLVRLNDGKGWKMKVEISLRDGSPISGDVSVQLWDNGNLFSNSSGSGEVRDLRSFGESSAAVILESSDTRFFQVYPTADGSTLFGNLYIRRADSRQFDFGGTARLEREKCAGAS